MITCALSHLLARCKERGYTLDEVRPCIVSEDGDSIIVDENHPAFPKRRTGPGTELKKLLAGWPLYIQTTPSCPCNRRALIMDTNGCDWCERNIDTIVGWLREEATRRSLPFFDAGAKLLVRRAISRARAQEKRTDASSPSPAPQPQTRAG